MHLKQYICLCAVLLLTACVTMSKNSIQYDENQVGAIAKKLKARVYEYTQDQTVYDVSFDDLNGDEKADAIVLLKGQDWCGSGGCTMLVFEGKAQQDFRFISKTTLVDLPISAVKNTQSTWKNLLVYTPKHGQVMLTFDGKTYPLNPSLLPIFTQKIEPTSGTVLFEQSK